MSGLLGRASFPDEPLPSGYVSAQAFIANVCERRFREVAACPGHRWRENAYARQGQCTLCGALAND